jgi:hypothetical protein
LVGLGIVMLVIGIVYHVQFMIAWIPERSATRLREADLNVLSKLGK